MEEQAESRRRYPARRSLHDLGHRSNIVFVTVCTKDRKPILATPEVHDLLRSCWSEADGWLVGRYVILPDHLHLFCAPAQRENISVKKWVTFWKFLATRRWPDVEQKPIWQRDLWDRQLRQGDSYEAKWDYVRANPVRHGLVGDVAAWPYQGEMHVLPWHDI